MTMYEIVDSTGTHVACSHANGWFDIVIKKRFLWNTEIPVFVCTDCEHIVDNPLLVRLLLDRRSQNET